MPADTSVDPYIERLIAQLPPLTAEQSRRLAALLATAKHPPSASPGKHDARRVVKHRPDKDEAGALTPATVTATAEKGPLPHDTTTCAS